MSGRRRAVCDLFLSRSWVYLIQEPRRSFGAHQEQRFCEHQSGIVCRVVWQNGGVLIQPACALLSRPLNFTLVMHASCKPTCVDIQAFGSRSPAFKRPSSASRTARIVEFGAATYKLRCTSLDSIAERSIEHIASHYVYVMQSLL